MPGVNYDKKKFDIVPLSQILKSYLIAFYDQSIIYLFICIKIVYIIQAFYHHCHYYCYY